MAFLSSPYKYMMEYYNFSEQSTMTCVSISLTVNGKGSTTMMYSSAITTQTELNDCAAIVLMRTALRNNPPLSYANP